MRRSIKLIELVVRGFVAGLQPLDHFHVAGRAGADSPARMLEINARSSVERDVQNAAGQTCRTIGQLGGIDLEDDWRSVRSPKGDLVCLLREFDFRFFNVWIGSAHVVFSLLRDRE